MRAQVETRNKGAKRDSQLSCSPLQWATLGCSDQPGDPSEHPAPCEREAIFEPIVVICST